MVSNSFEKKEKNGHDDDENEGQKKWKGEISTTTTEEETCTDRLPHEGDGGKGSSARG